jgi:hypothetical protein
LIDPLSSNSDIAPFIWASDHQAHFEPMKFMSLLFVPFAGAAFITPATAETVGLTAQQKADILNANTESSVDSALGSGGSTRQIHGEVGAMIGTNGMRSVYGTAAIPLDENAGALISFENSRYGRLR